MQKNKKGLTDEADKNCERVMLDETKPKRKSKAKQKPKAKTKIKRTYKDSLFRMIFANKENLLSLYNAVNDTNYTNPDELTVLLQKVLPHHALSVMKATLCFQMLENPSRTFPFAPILFCFYLDHISMVTKKRQLFCQNLLNGKMVIFH